MLGRVLQRTFQTFMSDLERVVFFFKNGFPPGAAFNYAEISALPQPVTEKSCTIVEVLKDAFLWAVPKKRLTIERRRNRKFGQIDQFYKLIIPKKDIIVCNHCGNDYRRGYLCNFCYNKVKTETTEMQEAIVKELGLNPIEEEVVVLYQGEKDSQPPEFWKGKRIVELPKERPAWFSQNLLQKSTQTTTPNTDVKVDNLG